MNISRRQLFKLCAGTVVASTITSLATISKKAWAEAREFKLTAAKETRNTCSYCSVGCGTLLYSTGAANGNIKQKIFHVEGDPDHPVSRGALCPKGAGLSGFVNSEQRLKFPEYRAPGSDKW
ncbi:formate dehydrogenase, partial [Photobacterium damselae subsp. damselae]|nr:formate dehydrogenase [Photobacterium damselae subsp. damselae]